jgi:hypothetical protein
MFWGVCLCFCVSSFVVVVFLVVWVCFAVWGCFWVLLGVGCVVVGLGSFVGFYGFVG